MINIEASQSFFSFFGIVFCILSFIAICIPSKTKFGIISLILGNIPLWSAIVFAKSQARFFDSLHIDLSTNLSVVGGIFGAVIFGLWFYLVKIFKKRYIKSDNDDNSGSAQSEVEKDVSDSKKEPSFDSNLNNSANPHIFDNLKVNDKE